eukprot:scaffold58945_cov37-Tisochrysis_lutea.AAC.5
MFLNRPPTIAARWITYAGLCFSNARRVDSLHGKRGGGARWPWAWAQGTWRAGNGPRGSRAHRSRRSTSFELRKTHRSACGVGPTRSLRSAAWMPLPTRPEPPVTNTTSPSTAWRLEGGSLLMGLGVAPAREGMQAERTRSAAVRLEGGARGREKERRREAQRARLRQLAARERGAREGERAERGRGERESELE